MDGKHGAPKSLMELIKTLKKKENFNVEVVTSIHNEVTRFCEENEITCYVAHHQLSSIYKDNSTLGRVKYVIKFLRYKFLDWYAIKTLEKKIDFNTIDIIHSNVSTVDIGSILAQKYKKNHILHIREFGMDDFGITSFRMDYVKFWNSSVTKFIAISKAVHDHLIKIGISDDKIEVIYNGISLNDIQYRKKRIINNRIKIVMSGSIMKTKGQFQLVEAVKLLPTEIRKKIQVDFIGDGDPKYINSLKKYILENNMTDQVNFLGYKSDVRQLLGDYEVGVTCSKSEAFGRVTVEYMASKLVTIVSNTGANPELIDDGINGYIYQYGDVQHLSNIIKDIYYNRQSMDSISNAARKKVEDKFTTQINAKNIYNLYEKLCLDDGKLNNEKNYKK